jgi:hypothetical protein
MKNISLRQFACAAVFAGFAHLGLCGDTPPPAIAAQIDLVKKDVENIDKSVGGLADAIRDKSDYQTKTFDQMKGALSQIRSGVENLNVRVPDDAFPVKLPEIRGHLDNLDNLLQQIQADINKSSAARELATTASSAKLAQLNGSLERIEQMDVSLGSDIGQLRKSLAYGYGKGKEPSEGNRPSWVLPVSLAALLALVTIFTSIAVTRASRALNKADVDRLAAIIAKSQDEVRIALHKNLEASSTELGRTLSGRERSAEEVLSLVQRLTEKVENWSATTQAAAEPADIPPDDRPTLKGFIPQGPNIPSSALWPAQFLDPSASIARWRDELETQVAEARAGALPVLAAWLSIRAVAERQGTSLAEIGDLVAAFSSACYGYWEANPQLSSDAIQQANTDWAKALRNYLAPIAPKLEVREIVPGVRFDSAFMQTVKEGVGNHLNVAEVHSWAILDCSGERPRVLDRARVTTT